MGGPLRFLTLVAAIALIVATCSPTVDGITLDGTSWRLVRLDSAPLVPGREPTLAFEVGQVSGSAGCNGYRARHVVISEGSITVRDLGHTLVGCGGPNGPEDTSIMDIEVAFIQALSAATTIEIREGRLVIAGPMGQLEFEPQIGPAPTLG